MNLDVQFKWQHGLLMFAILGMAAGSMMLMIALTDSGNTQAAPWWVGLLVLAASATAGVWGVRSLMQAHTRATVLQKIDQGMFALPESSSNGLILLNAAITSHFGFAVPEVKKQMPATFGMLVAAVTRQAKQSAAISPAQYDGVRSALAAVLMRDAKSIPWSSRVTDVLPAGKERFAAWEQLRQAIPALPPATLNPWVENIAIYAFMAALIAIAVPIVQHYEIAKKGTSLIFLNLGIGRRPISAVGV